MPNNSATGGYLSPTSTSPIYDIPLDIQIQSVVVGITGLPGDLVRPRWQPKPPAEPDRDANWCAIGIIAVDSDYGHYIQHKSAGDGSDESETYETLELLASFYGPQSTGLATLLRDGLWIAQNREEMYRNGMALLDVRRVTLLGEQVNTEIRRRADLPIQMRRVVSRTYPVLNLLQAQIALETESGYTQTSLIPEN